MMNRRDRGSFGAAVLAGLILAAVICHSAAAAEILKALQGRWGVAPGAPATMEWRPDGAGFGLTWGGIARGQGNARFEPSARPGVYAGHDAGQWSMFSDAEPVNPLVEGTLLWARTTADTAYVYSLTVADSGDFVLERYACRPSADLLSVTVLRWTAKGQQTDAEQKLVRIE